MVKFEKMGTLVCPLCCNSTFAHQKSLKQHLLDVVKNVQCPDCNERFETIVHLAYHLDGMCGSAVGDGVKDRDILALDSKTENNEIVMKEEPCRKNDKNVVEQVEEIWLEEEPQIVQARPPTAASLKPEVNYEKSESVTDEHEVFLPVMVKREIDQINEIESTHDKAVEQEEDESSSLENFRDDKTQSANSIEGSKSFSEEMIVSGQPLQSYSCLKCGVTFKSIRDHIKKFHNGLNSNIEKLATEIQKRNEVSAITINTEESCYINKGESNEERQDISPDINDTNMWEPDLIVSIQENGFEQNTNCDFGNTNDVKRSPPYSQEFQNKSLEKNSKNYNKINNHFECPSCRKIFTFLHNLQQHMLAHNRESVYECDTCGKCFSKRAHFEEHCTVHSDARPYQCEVCNRSFKCKATLVRHSRLHTTNHPHHCPVCNKAFTTRQHLERHVQIHTGEKPFKCHICVSSFSQSSSLTRHLVIHSGEKPYVCYTCKKAFSFQNDLKIHTRIHTGEKPYSCLVCNKSFTQKGNLIIHMRVHKPK